MIRTQTAELSAQAEKEESRTADTFDRQMELGVLNAKDDLHRSVWRKIDLLLGGPSKTILRCNDNYIIRVLAQAAECVVVSRH